MEKYNSSIGTITYEIVGTGKQTLILIPSGVGNSCTYDSLVLRLKDKYKLLLINLPGANGSYLLKPKISKIAGQIIELVKKLDVENPILVGRSYGGNVALSIVQSTQVAGIILFVSGEYFSILQRFLLKLVFLLPKKVKKLRPFFGKLITMLGVFDFSKYSEEAYDNIVNRWWEILSYKLPDIKINHDALIFFANKDKIINKKSIQKIDNIFINKSIFRINSGHLDIFKHFSDKEFFLIEEYLMRNF